MSNVITPDFGNKFKVDDTVVICFEDIDTIRINHAEIISVQLNGNFKTNMDSTEFDRTGHALGALRNKLRCMKYRPKIEYELMRDYILRKKQMTRNVANDR